MPKKDRIVLNCLRGRALDFLSGFSNQAEEALSKAARLDSKNVEVLNALGHVYWKKQDVAQSISCYRKALSIDENSKTALQHLSIVVRMENNADKKLQNTNESVQLANKAIMLDLKDGYSWYVLGNAHLTRFFIGGQDYEELNFALKAYTQAEQHSSYKNPDLYYNRAQIFSYLENYQKAIADFEAAHLIDPELNGHERAGKLIEFIK